MATTTEGRELTPVEIIRFAFPDTHSWLERVSLSGGIGTLMEGRSKKDCERMVDELKLLQAAINQNLKTAIANLKSREAQRPGREPRG